jgi:hypothetical protein
VSLAAPPACSPAYGNSAARCRGGQYRYLRRECGSRPCWARASCVLPRGPLGRILARQVVESHIDCANIHTFRPSIRHGLGILPSATRRSNSVAEMPQYMAASSRESPRRGTGRTCASGALTVVRPRFYYAGGCLDAVGSPSTHALPPSAGPRPSWRRRGTQARLPRRAATAFRGRPGQLTGLCNAYFDHCVFGINQFAYPEPRVLNAADRGGSSRQATKKPSCACTILLHQRRRE